MLRGFGCLACHGLLLSGVSPGCNPILLYSRSHIPPVLEIAGLVGGTRSRQVSLGQDGCCLARMLGPVPLPYGGNLGTVPYLGYGFAAQPPVKAPPNAHPPNVPWMPRPMATLGFLPLPVFDAVSGNRMMTRHGRLVYYVNVDITHTVADVEPVLRRMFSNPRLTVGRPIPEDPSLPILAVTNKRQGLSIILPLPQVYT